MKALLQSLTTLLLLLSLGGIANAQPAGARKHFAAAQEHFDSGRYLEAVDEYKAAYAAAPDKHALLYNIGLAYHRAGRVAEALDSYERYLELDPEGAAVDEVRDYVAQFRSLLGKDKASEEPVEEPVEEPPEEPVVDPTRPAKTEKPAPVQPPRKKPAPVRKVPMSKMQKRGWLIGGSGVGLLLVGVGTGLWALDTESEVEEIYNSGRPFPDGKNKRGKILDGATIGLATVGAAAVVAGAVYVWLGRDLERAQARDIALVPFADGKDTLGMSAIGFF